MMLRTPRAPAPASCPLFSRVPRIGILRSSLAGSWIRPRNTPPRRPRGAPIRARGGRYYLRLDFRFTEFSEVRLTRCFLLPYVHVPSPKDVTRSLCGGYSLPAGPTV